MFGFFIGGLLIGGVLLWLMLRLRNRGISLTWYDWTIGVIGLVLVGLGVWHFFGSLAEFYPTAGWLGLAIFGGIGLVLLAVSWQLIARRQRSAG